MEGGSCPPSRSIESVRSRHCGSPAILSIAAEPPHIRADQHHIDILTAPFVMHPDWFGVVEGSNLFGDIFSDLGPAVAGTIGKRLIWVEG